MHDRGCYEMFVSEHAVSEYAPDRVFVLISACKMYLTSSSQDGSDIGLSK